MLMAEFTTLALACGHRKLYGGWIFQSDCGRILWFNHTFTPTPIMEHPATRGLSGKLL